MEYNHLSYTIRPFCLCDASKCSLSTSFLSTSLSHPIGIAPTAFHRMAHPDGELATVRGDLWSFYFSRSIKESCVRSKMFEVSNDSLVMVDYSIGGYEETIKWTSNVVSSKSMNYNLKVWLILIQLYVYKDRVLTESIVRRAEKAGGENIILVNDSWI